MEFQTRNSRTNMGNWSVTFFFILQTSSTTRVPIVKPARRAGLGMQKNRTLLPGFTLMPRHRLSVAERRSVQQRKCEGKGINACYTVYEERGVFPALTIVPGRWKSVCHRLFNTRFVLTRSPLFSCILNESSGLHEHARGSMPNI
jgi:hypothetical protein